MHLSEALRHAIANGWSWVSISKWNGVRTDHRGVRTSTLLRMVLYYDNYVELNHNRWKWFDHGSIVCDSKEVIGYSTVYSNVRLELWKEDNVKVLERRRKKCSYMNAILQRRMRVVEERRKVKESNVEETVACGT